MLSFDEGHASWFIECQKSGEKRNPFKSQERELVHSLPDILHPLFCHLTFGGQFTFWTLKRDNVYGVLSTALL